MDRKVEAEGQHKEAYKYPTADRGCTDILCFLLFVAAVIAGFVVLGTAFANGNVKMVTAVYDSSGKACGQASSIDGVDYDLTEYKYLYFTTPFSADYFPYKTTCVKECPTTADYRPTASWCNTDGNVNVTRCTVSCDKTALSAASTAMETGFLSSSSTLEDPSVMCIYQTTVLLSRICMPDLSSDTTESLSSSAQDAINEYVNSGDVQRWIDAVRQTWRIILAAFFIAFGIGFVYLVLVRYFAGLLVWLSIIGFLVFLFVLSGYFYQESNTYKENNDDSNYKFARGISILLFILGCLAVILFVCMFNRIRLAIAVIKTAALYVGDVPFSLIVPLVTVIVCGLWFLLWIFVFVYAVSWYESIRKQDGSPFADVTWNGTQKGYMGYWLFFGLWLNALIQATEQFVLVGSVCLWYFRNRDETLHAPILRPFSWAFRYHLGSLAFGAFIIAVVQVIRLYLAYLEYQAKKLVGTKNKCLIYMLQCMQCYAECFERCIKFINKNAYVVVALKSTSFCSSAMDAMGILWNNALRAGVIQSMGAMFIFIGEIFICAITCFISYMIFINYDAYDSVPIYIPMLIIFVMTFTVGILFMSIYGLAIDAIFICFCIDESENANGQAKFTPEPLAEFMGREVKELMDQQQEKDAAQAQAQAQAVKDQ